MRTSRIYRKKASFTGALFIVFQELIKIDHHKQDKSHWASELRELGKDAKDWISEPPTSNMWVDWVSYA